MYCESHQGAVAGVGGFETEAAVGVVLLGFLSRLQQKTPTNKQDFLGGLWDWGMGLGSFCQ